MIYNWKLSPADPFAWEMQKYTGTLQFPLQDMHKSIHLGVFTAGDVSGMVAGRLFTFQKGDFYLTSPWEVHGAMFTRKGFELQMLTIDPDVLSSSLLHGRDELLTFFLLKPDMRFQLLGTRNLKQSFRRLFKTLQMWQKQSSAYVKTRQWLAIEMFIVDLLDSPGCRNFLSEVKNGEIYDKLQPALRELFFSSGMLTVGNAAEKCSLSVDYFSHLFKQCFGIPFAAYAMNYRLNRAADQMRKERLSLKEIARIYGFSDKSHFSRCFKKNFGITPGQFNREEGKHA